MIRVLREFAFAAGGKRYIFAAGLSTDSKPTTNVITGSVFCEVDTGYKYLFDEGTNAWYQKTSEQIESAVNAWLEAHPEATTTVQDGAITYAKLHSDLQAVVDKVSEQSEEIEQLQNTKANIDGYYEELTAGNAEQLISTVGVTTKVPYNFETAGGSADIGNRLQIKKLEGVTIAFNQLVPDVEATNTTDSLDIVTVDDAKAEDAEGVKVTFEPKQDLHGYDNPWPGGGNVNKLDVTLPIVLSEPSNIGNTPCVLPAGTYTFTSKHSASAAFSFSIFNSGGTKLAEQNTLASSTQDSVTFTITEESTYIRCYYNAACTVTNLQIEAGSAFTSFVPYSNICPITGYTGANVYDAGKNLVDPAGRAFSGGSITFYLNSNHDGIPLKANQAYTFSVSNVESNPNGIYFMTMSGSTLVSAYNTDHVSYTPTKDIIVKLNALYNQGQSSSDYENITAQLELGSSATTYEAFSGSTLPVTFPVSAGTVYGGYVDPVKGKLVVTGVTLDISTDAGTWERRGRASGYSGYYFEKILTSNFPKFTAAQMSQSRLEEKYSYAIVRNPYDYDGTSAWGYYEPNANKGIVRVGFDSSLGIDTTAKFDTWRANNTAQLYYPLLTPVEYSFTAQDLTLLLGLNNVWSDIGKTSLSYVSPNAHIKTLTGRKYLSRINGTDAIATGAGQEIVGQCGRDNIHDLTLMLGSDIADYIATLESGTSGAGASLFRSLFPKTKYLYNAGSAESSNVSMHKTTELQQWDEQWESGGYDGSTGEKVADANKIRCKNPIPIFPETVYYVTSPAGAVYWKYFYDENGNYLERIGSNPNATFTTPANACLMTFNCESSYGKTYGNDICFMIYWDGEHAGEYAPYKAHEYPLPDKTLRGILKKDSSGNLYADGDIFFPDGTIQRRYGIVDLGTLTWVYNSGDNSRLVADLSDAKLFSGTVVGNLICSKYVSDTISNIYGHSKDKTIGIHYTYHQVWVYDSAYTDPDVFKTAMSGVYLIYELATPTTEETDTYQEIQTVHNFGTEAMVDRLYSAGTRDMAIPLGGEFYYQNDLRAKVESQPNNPPSDGYWIVHTENGINTYVELASVLPSLLGN